MDYTKSLLAIIAAALLLPSCAEIEPTPFGGDIRHVTPDKPVSEVSDGLRIGYEASRSLSYEPLTKSQQTVADKEIKFSFEYFRSLCDNNINNIAVSPFSTFTTLSMFASGVKGDVYDELTTALHFDGLYPKDVADYCRNITSDLKELDNNVTFVSSNSMWYKPEHRHPIKEYVSLIDSCFGVKTFTLGIEPDNNLMRINKWAYDNSCGMIPVILKKTETPNGNNPVSLLLANVTYFEGAWTSDQYEKEVIKFTDIAGKETEINFFGPKDFQEMKGFNLGYGDQSLPSVLWIPYGNGGFSMVVILPPKDKSLDKFVSGLTAEKFLSYSSEAHNAVKVHFRIPVFENACDLLLIDNINALKKLGINKLFSHAPNVLNGMFEDEYACLENLHQSTKLLVTEKGTVATAITGAGEGMTSLALPQFRTFTADRPFVYAIVDVHNTILFMGTMTK